MAEGNLVVKVDVLNLEPVKRLHEAVCQAVALMNVSPDVARCRSTQEAHNILRQALIDIADHYKQ